MKFHVDGGGMEVRITYSFINKSPRLGIEQQKR
jgi:hypothetical protein